MLPVHSQADMLTSWYIQEYITPLLVEVEDPFDPLDKDMVDLTYEKPTPTPLQEVSSKPTEPADEEDEESALEDGEWEDEEEED